MVAFRIKLSKCLVDIWAIGTLLPVVWRISFLWLDGKKKSESEQVRDSETWSENVNQPRAV